MGIYIFSKAVLESCLDNPLTDFGHHVIPEAVGRHKVQSYVFGGYWRDIGTIRAFYDANMDLVKPAPAFDFNDPDWPFYTHPRYLPGSRVHGSRFIRSVLSEGTSADECTVESSIVGVRASLRRATIRRSLVMGADPYPPAGPPGAPPIGIGEGSLIQDAIIDKNARIGRNVRIVNKQGLRDGEGPGWVIRDGIVVVPKNAFVPDDTTI